MGDWVLFFLGCVRVDVNVNEGLIKKNRGRGVRSGWM